MSRKQSKANFLKNDYFISPDTHTYVYVSGGKKYLLFGKFGVLFFLKHPFWDSSFCLITDDFCQTIFEIILNKIIFFVPTKKYTRLLTNRLHNDTTWTNSWSKYEQKIIHEYCKYKTASLHIMKRRKVIMKIFCYFQQIVSQQKLRMKLELQSNRNRS